MMSDSRFPPRRAVLRNAMAWGIAWSAAAGAIVAAIARFDASPGIESLPERLGMALLSGIAWGVRFGVVGAAMGAVFAVVVRLGYRGRRLADIDPLRFALLGALVGGAGVPLFLQAMNVLSGDGPLAWRLVGDDAGWAAVFGAVAAAGSILLARRADALPQAPRPEPIARADVPSALPAAARHEIPLAPGTRSARS
jgi:MFS family permease